MNRPDVPISELGEIIANDPSLSTRLLKVANSAYYGLNHRLDTISRAISVVGFKDLKTMVAATAQTSRFSEKADMNANMVSFWKHSIATATFSQFLAETTLNEDTEKFFILGLLHDIGKLVIYSQVPEKYSDICNYSVLNQMSSYKMERKVLGFYHTLIGMELLKQWNFSKTYQEIIYFHHTPDSCSSYRPEAYIIHLADALAHAIGFGGSSPSLIPVVDTQAWEVLHLTNSKLNAVIARGQQHIEEITRRFLN